MFRGVNARETSLRSRVWYGPSVLSIDSSPRAIDGRLRQSGRRTSIVRG